jgi:hypothetical protein
MNEALELENANETKEVRRADFSSRNLKIIYVSYMHLSDKVARDWFIDFLIEKGAEVEYWDVTHLVFGKSLGRSKDVSYLRVPEHLGQIGDWLLLPENKDAQYVVLVSYEGRSAELYRLLSKYAVRMLKISWGLLPIKRQSNGWSRLHDLFIAPSDFARRAFYSFKAHAYLKLGLVRPYDVVFAAGMRACSSFQFARKSIPINLIDYDCYIDSLTKTNRVLDGRYAVFLDVNFPYHSDLRMIGLPQLEPVNYYASLRRFFSRVETEMGIEVLVAAHPQAQYTNDMFDGRRIYRGMTPALVRDAEFVISHHSTSISYAVLNGKPLVFVYTDEMEEIYRRTFVSYIRDFSEFLDSPMWNIDSMPEACSLKIKAVKAERYARYKYDYLTTKETEKMKTRDIFWHELTAWHGRGA